MGNLSVHHFQLVFFTSIVTGDRSVNDALFPILVGNEESSVCHYSSVSILENPALFLNTVTSLLGRSWAATTTEGLLIYSLDSGLIFDPFELDIDITPSNIHKTLLQKEYTMAIVMAFKLNEKKLIQEVIEAVPSKEGKWIFHEI